MKKMRGLINQMVHWLDRHKEIWCMEKILVDKDIVSSLMALYFEHILS
mgnify:CR=1 FL=1